MTDTERKAGMERLALPLSYEPADGGFVDYSTGVGEGPRNATIAAADGAVLVEIVGGDEDAIGQIVAAVNAHSDLKAALERFNGIIEGVETRCMATDGPVTPTLEEITEAELADLWTSVQTIRTALSGKGEAS